MSKSAKRFNVIKISSLNKSMMFFQFDSITIFRIFCLFQFRFKRLITIMIKRLHILLTFDIFIVARVICLKCFSLKLLKFQFLMSSFHMSRIVIMLFSIHVHFLLWLARMNFIFKVFNIIKIFFFVWKCSI